MATKSLVSLCFLCFALVWMWGLQSSWQEIWSVLLSYKTMEASESRLGLLVRSLDWYDSFITIYTKNCTVYHAELYGTVIGYRHIVYEYAFKSGHCSVNIDRPREHPARALCICYSSVWARAKNIWAGFEGDSQDVRILVGEDCPTAHLWR